MIQKIKPNRILLVILALALFLRVFRLGSFPPGLYSDETAYGYNAYSLLATGHDEYGVKWPLAFKSFGDFKPPMTAWLTIPSIVLLGLNGFAVRLPSAIAGTLTVLVVYFLTRELFPRGKQFSIFNLSFSVPEVASLLLAISPWHLQFSRSSMLVGIEGLFISLGVLLFVKSFKDRRFLYAAAISFVASLYTYYGSRLTVPLLVISLSLLFRKRFLKTWRHILGSAILALVLLSPLVLAAAKDAEILTGRTRTISIFYDPGIRAKLWEAHSRDGETFPSLLSRFFHNKPYFYFLDATRRYFQHFSYAFLVKEGDPTPPFEIPRMGFVFLADLLFALYGLYLVLATKDKTQKVLIPYLLIAPLPASLTFITPAANRSFNFVIPFTILSAVGVVQTLVMLKKKNLLVLSVGLVAIYLLAFGSYLDHYYRDIPDLIPHKWHYGRKELVEKVKRLEEDYDQIVFSNREGPAYIWLLFYQQYQPQLYWQTARINEAPDELGWLHIESFDKYVFPRHFDWETVEKQKNTLYVGYEGDDLPDGWQGEVGKERLRLNIVERIYYPNGKVAFELGQLE